MMPIDEFPQLPLFRDLTPAQLDLIRPLFVACDCHPGTVLFEQGEPAIFLYLIISGEVTIRYQPEDDHENITVTHVRDGGMVGWSAVIGRRFYTSAALCSQYTRFLRVRGSDLQVMCEQHPEPGLCILDRLANMVAERVHGGHPQIVALLGIGLHNGSH
jgi:CRP-like cAMP-binding protein